MTELSRTPVGLGSQQILMADEVLHGVSRGVETGDAEDREATWTVGEPGHEILERS